MSKRVRDDGSNGNGNGKASKAAHQVRALTATRYARSELHAAVMSAVEAETDRRHAEAYACSNDPLEKPAGGWRQYAIAISGPVLSDQGAHALEKYLPARRKLVEALRAARMNADIWNQLVRESPALAQVDLDDSKHVLTWLDDKRFRIDRQDRKVQLDYLLERFGAYSEKQTIGPTWWLKEPTNRDFALLSILAGWVPPAWRDDMTVAEAIESVANSVRSTIDAHMKRRASSGKRAHPRPTARRPRRRN